MKNQACCFTGHRNLSDGERCGLLDRIEFQMKKLIKQGVTGFLAGVKKKAGQNLIKQYTISSAIQQIKQYTHQKIIFPAVCSCETGNL